jgi:hypothetical protein
MAKGTPPSLFQGVFSSHPPIHDRIVRLQGLLHQASGAPAESADKIRARRKAAAQTVSQVTAASPEAMATVLGAMLEAKPVQQMIRALAENAPPGEAGTAQSPEVQQQGKGGADPSEAEYQKLYAYNLGLTGDSAKVKAERAPDSPTRKRSRTLRAVHYENRASREDLPGDATQVGQCFRAHCP